MDLRRALGPLSEPSFARYFTAVVISQAGSYASGIALSFAVLAVSNPTALRFIFLAREIPILVLLLVGGVLADRLPRRFVLAGASFVQGASQLVAAWTDSADYRNRRGGSGRMAGQFHRCWVRLGLRFSYVRDGWRLADHCRERCTSRKTRNQPTCRSGRGMA